MRAAAPQGSRPGTALQLEPHRVWAERRWSLGRWQGQHAVAGVAGWREGRACEEAGRERPSPASRPPPEKSQDPPPGPPLLSLGLLAGRGGRQAQSGLEASRSCSPGAEAEPGQVESSARGGTEAPRHHLVPSAQQAPLRPESPRGCCPLPGPVPQEETAPPPILSKPCLARGPQGRGASEPSPANQESPSPPQRPQHPQAATRHVAQQGEKRPAWGAGRDRAPRTEQA